MNSPRQALRARASASPSGSATAGLTRPASAHDLSKAAETFAAFAPLLDAMTEAMRSPDPAALQQATQRLQAGLGPVQAQVLQLAQADNAVQQLRLAQLGAQISSQIQAQRQALARAQAAAQRRVEVLLPASPGHQGYGAQGANERGPSTGAVQA